MKVTQLNKPFSVRYNKESFCLAEAFSIQEKSQDGGFIYCAT